MPNVSFDPVDATVGNTTSFGGPTAEIGSVMCPRGDSAAVSQVRRLEVRLAADLLISVRIGLNDSGANPCEVDSEDIVLFDPSDTALSGLMGDRLSLGSVPP